jgi:hypothetical protein
VLRVLSLHIFTIFVATCEVSQLWAFLPPTRLLVYGVQFFRAVPNIPGNCLFGLKPISGNINLNDIVDIVESKSEVKVPPKSHDKVRDL